MRAVLTLTLPLLLVAGAASAIEIERSVTVAKPPAEVWAVVGPFCAIGEWHPVVAECEESTKDGAVHRLLTTADGATIFERRTASDEAGMSYTYAILESPLPVGDDYQATFSVVPDGSGSKVVWQATFTAENATDEEAEKVIGGIFDSGLASIQEKLAD